MEGAVPNPSPMTLDFPPQYTSILLDAVAASIGPFPDLLARPAPTQGWEEVGRVVKDSISLDIGVRELQEFFWHLHSEYQEKKSKGKEITGGVANQQDEAMEAILNLALAGPAAPARARALAGPAAPARESAATAAPARARARARARALADSESDTDTSASHGLNRRRRDGGEQLPSAPPRRRPRRSSPASVDTLALLLIKARAAETVTRELAVVVRELVGDAQARQEPVARAAETVARALAVGVRELVGDAQAQQEPVAPAESDEHAASPGRQNQL